MKLENEKQSRGGRKERRRISGFRNRDVWRRRKRKTGEVRRAEEESKEGREEKEEGERKKERCCFSAHLY